jgi:hypothetical protein
MLSSGKATMHTQTEFMSQKKRNTNEFDCFQNTQMMFFSSAASQKATTGC